MHTFEEAITIGLNEIVELEDIPDRPLNTANVEALVASNEPDKWPPIIVTPLGNNKFGRIAGKHRVEAARKLERNYIKALVRQYPTKIDMYADSWEDNAKNGLPLTTKQRKEYAVNLHRLQPSLSYRELGRRAGLRHETVKAAIEEETQAERSEEDKEIDAWCKMVNGLHARCLDFLNKTEDYNVRDSAAMLVATYTPDELEDAELTFDLMWRVLRDACILAQEERKKLA